MTAIDRLNGVHSGLPYKAPCRVATTANITLSGIQTIDGVLLASGDRVLVWNQSSAIDNGIWVVSSGNWSRALDFNGNRDATEGTKVFVTDGSTYGGVSFYVSSIGTIGADVISLSVTKNMEGFRHVPLRVVDGSDITASLNAILAIYGSGVSIAIPSGNFTLSSTVTISNRNVRITGVTGGSNHNTGSSDTEGGTILTATHTSGPVFRISNMGNTLADLVVDANAARSAGAKSTNFGIHIEGDDTASGSAARTMLMNVQVTKQPHHGIVMVGTVVNSILYGVDVDNCKGHGLYADGGTLTSRTNKQRPGQVNVYSFRSSRNDGHSVKIGNIGATALEIPYRFLFDNMEAFYNLLDQTTYTTLYDAYIFGENHKMVGCAHSGIQLSAEGAKGGLHISGTNHVVEIPRFLNCEPYVTYIADSGGSITTTDIEIILPFITHSTAASNYYNPAIYVESTCRNIKVESGTRVGTVQTLISTSSDNLEYKFKTEKVFKGKQIATFKSGSASPADDSVFYIEFNGSATAGVLEYSGTTASAGAGRIYFRCGDGSAHISQTVTGSGGPTCVLATSGTAPTGTTGTDVRLNITAMNNANRIYFENRTGATRTYQLTLTSCDNYITTIG